MSRDLSHIRIYYTCTIDVRNGLYTFYEDTYLLFAPCPTPEPSSIGNFALDYILDCWLVLKAYWIVEVKWCNDKKYTNHPKPLDIKQSLFVHAFWGVITEINAYDLLNAQNLRLCRTSKMSQLFFEKRKNCWSLTCKQWLIIYVCVHDHKLCPYFIMCK